MWYQSSYHVQRMSKFAKMARLLREFTSKSATFEKTAMSRLLQMRNVLLKNDLQESLTQRSSPLVYCFPFVRKFILIGMFLLGLKTTLNTCFPVHSFTGCKNNNKSSKKVITL